MDEWVMEMFIDIVEYYLDVKKYEIMKCISKWIELVISILIEVM